MSNKRLSRQIPQFIVVGGLAAAVHLGMVMLIVPLGLTPLLANVIGFLTAFQVSYWGHRNWTFSSHNAPHRSALPRFFGVACVGFGLNEILFYLLLRFTPLPYPIALFLVLLAVAALTFVSSRYWAFRRAH